MTRSLPGIASRPSSILRIALLLIALCARAVTAVGAETNEEMESAIRGTLVDKLGEDASGIRVAFYDGRAVLTGKVVERSTAELAKEVALFVRGVATVRNHVEAEKDLGFGPRKLDAEAADSSLESNVKNALRRDIGHAARDVEVEAVDGRVSLRGRLPDALRHQVAMNAATATPGVKSVVDLLVVPE